MTSREEHASHHVLCRASTAAPGDEFSQVITHHRSRIFRRNRP